MASNSAWENCRFVLTDLVNFPLATWDLPRSSDEKYLQFLKNIIVPDVGFKSYRILLTVYSSAISGGLYAIGLLTVNYNRITAYNTLAISDSNVPTYGTSCCLDGGVKPLLIHKESLMYPNIFNSIVKCGPVASMLSKIATTGWFYNVGLAKTCCLDFTTHNPKSCIHCKTLATVYGNITPLFEYKPVQIVKQPQLNCIVDKDKRVVSWNLINL